MLHATLHWTAYAKVKLWPMAINYVVSVFNRLPQLNTGVSPNKVWSQSRYTHEDFWRARVFGYPVYGLEPKLQDGKNILEWDPRAHLGMFVGFSYVYSSLVASVLYIHTGKIFRNIT